MKKNDWVEWKSKNKDGVITTNQGIVQSVSAAGTAVVHYKFTADSYMRVKAPIKHFTAIPTPEINLDGGTGFLKTWSVRGYKAINGHDGPMFTCTIYKDGKKAISVHNEGMGGGNGYDPVSGAKGYETVREFTAAADALWDKFTTRERKFSHDDSVLDWMLNLAKAPVSIEVTVASYDAQMAKWDAESAKLKAEAK